METDYMSLILNSEPKGQNVCICSITVGDPHWKALGDYTFPINWAWGRTVIGPKTVMNRHEGDLSMLCLHPRPASWYKLILMASMISTGYNVIWIDADAILSPLFPDPFLKLEDGQFATAVDQNGPNCGFIAMPYGRESLKLLARWWCRTEEINHPWWEQKALHNMMREDNHLAANWHGIHESEGIIHAAGVPVQQKLGWLKERVGF